jgi:purine-binding chemotaxis protein CheW
MCLRELKEESMEESQARGLAAEMKQLISFTVGAEEYGLELSRVKEVIRMRQVTWLPKAPASVKGVINLRGDVIPIVDLRERFALAAQTQTAMTRVIVVEVQGRMVGMVVDVANQVVRVPADQFDPPPSVMGGTDRGYVTAVGKLGDRLVVMINVDRILSTDEIDQIEGSLAAAEPGLAASRA